MRTLFSVFTLCAFLMTSCIKERCKSCNQTPDLSLKCVTFTGDYFVLNQTKTETKPFPSGIQASIITFNAGDNPIIKSTYPGTPIGATSQANGNLVLNGGVNLFMPNGVYDFYSVSTNTSSAPAIIFTNGISGNLSNGTDYLWASNKNMIIAANTFVPLQFSHRSAAISLSIVAGEGLSSLEVKNILISQSKEGSEMNLSSGVIHAANSISAIKAAMNLTSNTGTFIMLPIKSGVPLPVELYVDAVFGGKPVTNKKYSATIPSPSGGFESGTLYKFTASIEAKGVTFINSTLEDWDDQSFVNITLTE